MPSSRTSPRSVSSFTFCKIVGQLKASLWVSSIWETRSLFRIQRRVFTRLRRLTSMLLAGDVVMAPHSLFVL